ncbi:uncharacterized protein EI90DRAFT_3034053 [Cantharellus anzutake]|uniref:uncharacterized protein n=1 Tax=Cantharellus anzutake TaxID=1750568 RepID=UPI001908C871|nr:uncharacterized protein EI90DRAFT_3034053 [Cantharellus anzutake]KAF8341469.1 hypothetical protein EI90DRAFT_3034053 [Cantharellus anzutake]
MKPLSLANMLISSCVVFSARSFTMAVVSHKVSSYIFMPIPCVTGHSLFARGGQDEWVDCESSSCSISRIHPKECFGAGCRNRTE